MTKGGKKKDQISPNSLNSWHLNFMHQSLFIIGKSRTKKNLRVRFTVIFKNVFNFSNT